MLEIAEAGVYRVVWSEAIFAELEDTLLYLFDQAGRDPQESRSAIHRLRQQMVTAFPDVIVMGWEPLEDACECRTLTIGTFSPPRSRGGPTSSSRTT